MNERVLIVAMRRVFAKNNFTAFRVHRVFCMFCANLLSYTAAHSTHTMVKRQVLIGNF